MFKFLKDKLKAAVSKFSKDAEEETEEVPEKPSIISKIFKKKEEEAPAEEKAKEPSKPAAMEEPKKKAPEPKEEEVSKVPKEPSAVAQKKPSPPSRDEEKKEKPPAKEEPKAVEEKPPAKEEPKTVEESPKEVVEPQKRGFFQKVSDAITKKPLSEAKFEELFFDLEVALMENNVAVEVIDRIKADLKKELVGSPVLRGKIQDIIMSTLSDTINDILDTETFDLVDRIKSSGKRPYVIAFVGVNGSGKTTNLAKVAKKLQDAGLSCVMAACDTFRAAAIQQIEEHAQKLGIKLIKHDYGSDAAAVAFDAVKHAQSKGKDVVLIDTAGRTHTNTNLMQELAKVVRIAKPDLSLFVGDSLTGNDVVEQAKQFNDAVGFDGIILTKLDVDEKGGAAISISYVTGKPILYYGTGQTYADLKPFDKSLVLKSLEMGS